MEFHFSILAWKSHGQKNLESNSPWNNKGLVTTWELNNSNNAFPHPWDSCGDAKNNPSASSRRVSMQADGAVFPLQCLYSSPPETVMVPGQHGGMLPYPSNQMVRYLTKQGQRTKGPCLLSSFCSSSWVKFCFVLLF